MSQAEKPGWSIWEAIDFMRAASDAGASISIGPGPAWASVYLITGESSRHVVFLHDGRVSGITPSMESHQSTYEWLSAEPANWRNYLGIP